MCCLVELIRYADMYRVGMLLGSLFSSLCSTLFSEDIFELMGQLKGIIHPL